MTSEAQRIAIAEACGWHIIEGEPPTGLNKNWTHSDFRFIPDYLNDLDAMHEAENGLTENQYDDFVCFLCPEEERKHYKSWGLEGIAGIAPRFLVSPTAAQRAEAFLRTLNLWTES